MTAITSVCIMVPQVGKKTLEFHTDSRRLVHVTVMSRPSTGPFSFSLHQPEVA